MPLKAFVPEITSVEASLQSLYTKTDTGYVLDVDQGDYKNKLDEFRNNNIQYQKDKQTALDNLEKYKDVDIDKYNSFLKTADDLENNNLIKKGDYDILLKKETDKIKTEYDGKINVLETGKQESDNKTLAYKSKLDNLAINDVINKAVVEAGVPKKGALADIISRARQVWSVNENGIHVAKEGDTLLFGKDGKAHLTAEEWAKDLMTNKAPHLFEQNSGGGAPGSGNSGGNPAGKIYIKRSEIANYIGKDRKNIVFTD